MNPFDVLGQVDRALDGTYQTLYQALQGQAALLAVTFLGIWIVYIGARIALGSTTPLMEYIWSIVKMSVLLQLALRWDVAVQFFVPLLTNWPFDLASIILGGETTQGVFSTYTNTVWVKLLDLWESTSWREVPQLIILIFAGFLPVGLMTAFILAMLIMAKLAIAALLTFAPIFFVLAIWDSTRNLFVSFLRQLINFSIIAPLLAAIMSISSLVFLSVADDLSVDTGLQLGKLISLGIINYALYQLIKQVPLIATGIAGGMMLSGQGLGAAAVGFAAGALSRMARPAMDYMNQQGKAAQSGGALLGAAGAAVGAAHSAPKVEKNTLTDAAVAATQALQSGNTKK